MSADRIETAEEPVDQPDGIGAESVDDLRIPSPAKAAERVDAFVRWFGDGSLTLPPNYPDVAGPPLFMRDLCALTCAVQHGYRANEPGRCLHRPDRPSTPTHSTDPTDLHQAIVAVVQGHPAHQGRDGIVRRVAPWAAEEIAGKVEALLTPAPEREGEGRTGLIFDDGALGPHLFHPDAIRPAPTPDLRERVEALWVEHFPGSARPWSAEFERRFERFTAAVLAVLAEGEAE
jgi:hypothetical protein